MSHQISKHLLSTASFAVAAMVSVPTVAFAQSETSTAAPALADDPQDIVVTAERRSASVQSLPISISAVTDADIERKAIISVSDLQRFTPSLSITETGLARFVNIRGIGQSASLPQIQPGIAYHVDGVFTRGGFNEVPFYDVARVEVLRGPQGTLSGQSSTGGAIFVVSQVPKLGVTSGYIEASYANYRHATGEAAVNVPISDKIALRAAVFTEHRDSYFTILSAPGSQLLAAPAFHPGNLGRMAIRLSLLAQPTDNLQVIVRGEYYNRKSDGFAFKPTAGDPSAIFNGVGAWTVAPADPFTIDYNVPGKADLNIRRGSLEVKWDFSDNFQLRSLSSVSTAKVENVFDQDGTGTLQVVGAPANPRDLVFAQAIKSPATTQEFNLITTGTGPLQGVLGLYYFNGNSPYQLTNATISLSQPYARILSKAVFGQFTYALSDRLEVVGGLRYNIDEYKQSGGTIKIRAIPNSVFAPVAPTESRTNAVTGKVSVNFKAAADQLLYASAARGYKAGGPNSSGLPSFTPEYVWSYEAGLKSKFLDRHLTTQAAVFYSNYRDYQINAFDPSLNLQYVQNAGSAKIYGIEFQGQLTLGAFSLDGSISRVHTEFGNARNGTPIALADTRYAVGNASRGPITITGLRLPFAQNWTASAGAQYAIPIGKASLTPRIQYSYNGDQWGNLFQKSYDYIPHRDTIDLRLTFAKDDWTIAAYVTNLENNTYVTGKFNGDDYLGAPREFGAKFGYRF